MDTSPSSPLRLLGAVLTTLVGVAFFFAIIGVFGLPISISALLLLILIAVPILRRPQAKGGLS